ncbi:YeiH family protein [Pseudohalocynthiibacter aestuariivivens]|uniref:YeiH family protein n=1 Tax=Pseudohalocynthiibacter aestuariivivens TaxID=1591409 RepID=A0ABV5JCN1_9RHOB|nr:putative sulfate exporter family transporter [Pseudohalocynthiibacter aestuariivivens]MBS9717296.1 putative sulfate exporter family transporter [Pseudohalocynthiibacter aestuariivivens]
MLPFIRARWNSFYSGILLAVVIAIAASFLSEHYGAPVMLFALLIGMAFHFLSEDESCVRGIEFSSKPLLRFGVGLLGLRLSIGDVTSLGLGPVLAVVGFVLATLGCGALMSLLLGRRMAFGLLAGGSVAICGASAALAITAVLPPRSDREQDTLFVVIGVTALSTIAMIAYPVLFQALGLTDIESGFLIGATIHDVAQVVGAGYSISDEAGVIATFVKMLRVALLPVVILVAMFSFRGAQTQRLSLPWFLVMFLLLAMLANSGLLPETVIVFFGDISRWCLVVAISALGVKTSLAKIVKVKPSYSAILIIETIFLLIVALGYVTWVGI